MRCSCLYLIFELNSFKTQIKISPLQNTVRDNVNVSLFQFVDEDGFTTRSILCMPVYNSERKITAVTQLINKQNGSPFNDSDANIIEVRTDQFDETIVTFKRFFYHRVRTALFTTTVHEQAQSNQACNIFGFIVLDFLWGFILICILNKPQTNLAMCSLVNLLFETHNLYIIINIMLRGYLWPSS